MPKFPPKAVIFDLDGTLADTFDLVISSFVAVCRPHLGRDLTRDEVISRFGVTECAMIRNELPAPAHDAAVAKFLSLYTANHARMVRVFDGIEPMLADLASRSIPMAIMTGKGRDTADITLAKLGWTHLFSSVITGDDVTNPKPAPDGVLIAARELGVEPTACLFVGDSPADIRAGQSAGAATAWASWHPVYAREISELNPTLIARTPADIIELFMNRRES